MSVLNALGVGLNAWLYLERGHNVVNILLMIVCLYSAFNAFLWARDESI